MGKMAAELSAMLVQEQAAFGTAETDLVAADVVETIGVPTMKWNPEGTEIALTGGGFDQDAFVPGAGSYEVDFQVYMTTGNAEGSYGQAGKMLDLSGMKKTEADTGTDLTNDQATWEFSSTRSEWKDATIWGYSGDLSTSSALLRKMSNVIFVPKWTLEAGKPTIMELSGVGVFGGKAVAATAPTITKQRVSPPALLGATTMTINGDSDYKLLSASIDAGQEITLTKDVTQTYGRDLSNITNRKITWTATVYQDLPSVVDPETALLGRTEGAFTIVYGTTPNKITFTADYSQITDIELADDEGTQVWTLSGQLNRNDFSVIFDTAPAT